MYERIKEIFPLGFINLGETTISLKNVNQYEEINVEQKESNCGVITKTIFYKFFPDNTSIHYDTYNIYDVNDFNKTNHSLLNDYGQIIYRKNIQGKEF